MGLMKVFRGPHRWRRPGGAPTVEPAVPEAPLDWRQENALRIEQLRRRGVKIGDGCYIFTMEFSTEPFLVEIGNRVAVAGGTQFLTHDGAVWLLRPRRPDAQHFGRISVGDNTYIGQNCLILPGSRIGADCVIGAGAVVRGTIPGNSVAAGNPARVIGRTSLFVEMLDASEDTLDTWTLPEPRREDVIREHFGLPPRPITPS